MLLQGVCKISGITIVGGCRQGSIPSSSTIFWYLWGKSSPEACGASSLSAILNRYPYGSVPKWLRGQFAELLFVRFDSDQSLIFLPGGVMVTHLLFYVVYLDIHLTSRNIVV